MSGYERTGWRDQEISRRHRMWGDDCPCVDVDFLVVEYNTGMPVMIVDYKRFTAPMPDLTHKSYKALVSLADGYKDTPLPFIIAFYWPDVWAFRIIPVNDRANDYFSANEILTELEYVRRLYQIRSITLAKYLTPRLNTSLPLGEIA